MPAVGPDTVALVWAPVAQAGFLAGAGLLAGAVGSSGAIGSLISYPAVLIVGIPPLPANVTHAVAVVGSGIGSTVQSRPELRGSWPRLAQWSIISAVGAAGGTALLLGAPGDYFRWAVPFLVAIAAVLLIIQPQIYAWREKRAQGRPEGRAGGPPDPPRLHRTALPYLLFAVGIYDGYFGAASGVMTLAVLMLTVETQLVRANAIKNTLLGVADVVAAISFAIFGPVHWAAAVALGLGYLGGGTVGPMIARRIPSDVLRMVIAVAGFGLAGWLLYDAITS
jgi:uncharacterized protein